MLTKKSKKIVVAMSGGVDSSVAAALLKEQGYQITGVTMKLWDGPDLPREGARHGCYGPGETEDIEDARKVARILGIPFHVFNLKEEYKTEVLDYFRLEYLSGRTPNPCIRCNRSLKFGALVSRIEQSGIEFDYLATGHYARKEYDKINRRYLLKKARDLTKDQSYFIALLSQEQLGRALFPIGDYTKAEVRGLATDFGLAVAKKAESQDFIVGGYSSLLPETAPGPILDMAGNVLGEHQRISDYTIGQRRGLGISSQDPLFVIDIAPERNAIIVGRKEELYRDELNVSGLNWVAIDTLLKPLEVEAKLRHRHQEADAKVSPLNDDKVHVKFREPQMAITPGQTVVFYGGDVVIGAGTIEKKGGGTWLK
ncbi:MAG: tRNA 2-thiouridine(34) synthase MnmA [Dehalococcoidales bacterium]|jgi:tRNA-specific 2-thiouridylase|nr:tRNA 2-thiouridine(34) synthase MnmA [Dehalococcoidales bacterium]MDP6737918.1 tRNA 2-thiouridine(34) synthase MnmA [Dehalococcoidales bacterium]|tara:strand:- start:65 stop:1171 length:1107 start_codon:yes stop_codon:yes gene_type:complete